MRASCAVAPCCSRTASEGSSNSCDGSQTPRRRKWASLACAGNGCGESSPTPKFFSKINKIVPLALRMVRREDNDNPRATVSPHTQRLSEHLRTADDFKSQQHELIDWCSGYVTKPFGELCMSVLAEACSRGDHSAVEGQLQRMREGADPSEKIAA